MNAILILAVTAVLTGPQDGREELLKKDIEAAVAKLGSDRYTESYVAGEELVEIGRPAVPRLLEELAKEKLAPAAKRAVCELLGRIRDPRKEVVSALSGKLKDTDEYGTTIAAAAARALASVGDPSCIPALIETLNSKQVETDRILKYECIRALGLFRAKEAEEPLRKALEDKKTASLGEDDPDARMIATAAADALGLIRASQAVEDLGALLSDKDKDPSTEHPVGVHAARALQRILASELEGKTAKEEPRAGTLTGASADITKTLLAWQTWWGGRQDEKDVAATKESIAKVAKAVEAYKKGQGDYPLMLMYLKRNPDAKDFPKDGYTQESLRDAWGESLKYKQPGTGAAFDVWSLGKDKRPWGPGAGADLWNHDAWIEIKKDASRKAMKTILDALEKFKADQGVYPDQLPHLRVKPVGFEEKKPWPEGGYLKEIPVDGFDRMFAYNKPGTGDEPFDLISLGADFTLGGERENEDLWNHDKRPEEKKEKAEGEK